MIFAKFPVPGKVKTRLAQSLGYREASEAYRRMVEQVVENTTPSQKGFVRSLYVDPPERISDFQSWLPEVDHYEAQRGENLGERLAKAFASSHQKTWTKALIIGTDCLEVDEALIMEAFAELENHDLVLGPARDGGYYLIGMKQNYPELFQDIPWSTDQVFSTTLIQAKKSEK